jgi:nitroreductase
MIRSFTGEPVNVDELDAMCVESLRAPTAGNSCGVSYLTVGPDRIGDYFTVATDEQWRADAARAPGLMRASGVVLVLCDPSRYTDRYAMTDKTRSGLRDRDAWPLPYWHTDAAMATMALLLLIEEAGWGATLWGAFRHVDEVLAWASAPAGTELFCSVLVGVPDPTDPPSASLDRVQRPRVARVRRVL